MLNQPMILSQARENFYEKVVLHTIRGGVILVTGLILLWIRHFAVPAMGASPWVGVVIAIPWIVIFAGGCLLVWAAWVFVKSQMIPFVVAGCPYCDASLKFTSQPTSDFDCDQCHRHVQFEDGFMLPVQIVECSFCSAKHRVSIKAQTYTCDRCNQVIKLTTTSNEELESAQPLSDTYYDVILTQAGKNADQVAQLVESIMVCTLKEARAVMERLPAPIMQDIPHLKAESLRDQIRALGAMAIIIPGNRIPTNKPLARGGE